MELASLADQAEAVGNGTVRAVEILDHYLARASASDLNAYIEVHDEARDQAEQVDAAVAAQRDPGPLAGTAIALKDLIDHQGHTTTCGSGFYRHQPTKSATVAARLESAGAVIIGRTGLHEFAFGFSSENEWFGPVRNPWDPDTSPGGSSGGSASATAASLCSGAIGTDTGGSIRVPAALCGLFGLKVTQGRVPLTGVFPLAPSLDTVGPLARSMEDLTLMYLTLSGHDPSDPWAVPVPVESPQWKESVSQVIGVPTEWTEEAPMPAIERVQFEKALEALEKLGARLRWVDMPQVQPPGMAAELISAEVAAVHRQWYGHPEYPYGKEISSRLEDAFAYTADQYVEAQAWRAGLRNRTRQVFDEVDLLITPAVPAARKVIGQPTISIDDEQFGYQYVLSWFSYLVNHMGAPAIAMPLAASGTPPPSIQLIGPWWSEHRLLEIGWALQQAGLVGFREPPQEESRKVSL